MAFLSSTNLDSLTCPSYHMILDHSGFLKEHVLVFNIYVDECCLLVFLKFESFVGFSNSFLQVNAAVHPLYI